MAANMYRVGGMYVNVDLFHQTHTFLSTVPPLLFFMDEHYAELS